MSAEPRDETLERRVREAYRRPVPMAPFAKSITPVMCVGVSTLIFLPISALLVAVRSGNVIRVEPVTRLMGPIKFTSAVR